jgi:Tol biopolymer transport system component
MAKKLILFLFFVLVTQNFKSQNVNILDAKFSPTSNIIALIVGDNRNTDIRLYFSEKNELSQNLIADSLKQTTVREFEFSPEGDKIALLLTTNMITDLFLYEIENRKLIRCTNSNDLKNYNLDFAYKNSLIWCDNQNVIFLSKHSGLVQQYIFNFTKKTFEANGASNGNEYFLTYSRKNQESYYIAGINNREPSVYRRKLGSTVNLEISKDGNNHMTTILSDNNNYLFYSVMPVISPCIYDLNSSKLVKTKLPKSNIRVIGWVEKDTNIVYTFSHFESDENIPVTDLFSYNYLTQKKRLISNGIEPNFGVLCSPDGTKIIYTKTSKPSSISPNQKKYKLEESQTFISDNKGTNTNLSCYGLAKDWSIDNKTVVFVNGNNLVILDVDSGNKKSIQIEN